MSIFSSELAVATNMFQVQNGTLRVLSEQPKPLNYVIGGVNLIDYNPDNRLAVFTRLIGRFIPAFSDADVFNQSVVDRLQSLVN